MNNTEQLNKDIEIQREENIQLFNIFQYRLHEECMQELIIKWRDGSKRIKQLISLRNEIMSNERKIDKEVSRQEFVNGHGEATRRNITTTIFEQANRRLSKQIINFIS